jgi:ERCC4-type nuclease
MFSTLRSPAEKTQVISAMTSLSHFKGFSVFRTSSIQETADLLNGMYNKLTKEYGKGKPPAFVAKAFVAEAFVAKALTNDTTEESKEECPIENYASFAKKTKCENITPENMGEIILTQIPGIHSVTARAIMSRFQGKLAVLLDELKNPASTSLDNITYVTNEKTRRINRTAIENLRKYLL